MINQEARQSYSCRIGRYADSVVPVAAPECAFHIRAESADGVLDVAQPAGGFVAVGGGSWDRDGKWRHRGKTVYVGHDLI